MMKGIFLLLGSNLGDRESILRQAADLINDRIGKVIKMSSVYSTKAWGIEDQPDFLNQVVEVNSILAPNDILGHIHAIEHTLGRIRQEQWSSRIIDIDLLYFGSEIIDSPELTVPHPHIQRRNFALVPLTEIAPDLLHPKLGLSQVELLRRSTDQLSVEKVSTR